MKYQNIREEELKNKVAQDYFWLYDCSKIIGNVDFCVSMHKASKEATEQESLLWAEAKKNSSDIYKSVVQLVLTIGKARTFDKYLPPPMLGAFDSEKIAFIPYNEIHDVFYQNDFNWNVTPSDYSTKEFQLIYEKVKNIIDQNLLLFYFEKDDKELKKFIKSNFIPGHFGFTKIKIDKNNFMVIYNKWLQEVKPTIAVNWDVAKKSGIIDGDFYLADLLSSDNETLKEKLFVLLRHDHYELDRRIDESGMFSRKQADFNDGQKAHTQFWNKYERPPKEEYWDYIVERRDLLVPQDIRERKGSFFTPQIWVELSQKYLTDMLGENWQDEYYVWDCAAGTGNLLAGLTNKYNIWASTLDQQDVEVMHDRISNGANLLHDHVFQFDFLNDDFSKVPLPLQTIINDPEKRKKLVVYINPPYKRGLGVANTNFHNEEIGEAKDELYIQFLYRIYKEINGCKIGIFSKLKLLNAPDFETMRLTFQAKLEKLFIVPAYTFDNVKGKFPIGFQFYDTSKKEIFHSILADVYDEDKNMIKTKWFSNYNNAKFLNKWLISYKYKYDPIAKLIYNSNDFQHQNRIRITNFETTVLGGDGKFNIDKSNLLISGIYFSVRHCIEPTWLNDRDQFLYPNDGWETDTEFQNDCLAFTLFHSQNRITSKEGTNHWIPFTEVEVNAREKFESHFMSDFIKGKPKLPQKSFYTLPILFEQEESYNRAPIKFSEEATAVFDAGRELWKYYHRQPNCNVNASLYDIKEHFQGRNDTGKMNNKSSDETYMNLIGNLREKLRLLSKKIEPKVYEYGFLKG
ncbi:MAG: hypothetical protein BWZ06_00188 [Bacteroidetes bacterium ADurb.BinA261]|jgi:hypothetical protein|nr:hypothetical protein [Dysgonamonadaceae bacterium]OPZ15457.1 MAG: hypothetical protein BWZ06_00188 [Bacteroidetes bacterium ADurb.BinA261]